MKLTIDNRDLSYTIDTYGMFTGDSVQESEADHYREEYNLTDDEWRELGFDYDHPAIVKELALRSIDLLYNQFCTHGNGIVMNILFKESKSPQFYNYTTDHYTAEWIIDEDRLKQYISERDEDFRLFAESEWSYEMSKAVAEDDAETQTVIAIDFYTRQEYSAEDYESAMFELEWEAYSNNMKLDAESEALIEKKEVENGNES